MSAMTDLLKKAIEHVETLESHSVEARAVNVDETPAEIAIHIGYHWSGDRAFGLLVPEGSTVVTDTPTWRSAEIIDPEIGTYELCVFGQYEPKEDGS